jgi:hypothetical protein
MPLRNDLDACLRRLKAAITSVNLSSADATKAWTDTQAAYEAAAGKQLHRSQTRSQPQHPEHQSISTLFEDWVQGAVNSDLPGLHRVARYAYEDLYHRLPHDKKVLVDNLTKRFDLDAFPRIFFAFGPSIVTNSRQALESAVRIKKKRPAVTLSELVSALREARINRAANSWRGSVVDATRFVLQDFKEAERVLLAAGPSTADDTNQGGHNKEGREGTDGPEAATGSRAEANTKKLLQNRNSHISIEYQCLLMKMSSCRANRVDRSCPGWQPFATRRPIKK